MAAWFPLAWQSAVRVISVLSCSHSNTRTSSFTQQSLSTARRGPATQPSPVQSEGALQPERTRPPCSTSTPPFKQLHRKPDPSANSWEAEEEQQRWRPKQVLNKPKEKQTGSAYYENSCGWWWNTTRGGSRHHKKFSCLSKTIKPDWSLITDVLLTPGSITASEASAVTVKGKSSDIRRSAWSKLHFSSKRHLNFTFT